MIKGRSTTNAYLDFCDYAGLNKEVYSFEEFEDEYLSSFKFRMVVVLVVVFSLLIEIILDKWDNMRYN